MTFTLKHGKQIDQFEGFQNYTGKSSHMLIVMEDGEPNLYDWDGSDSGVEELKRYFKLMNGPNSKAVRPLMYTEIL